MKNNFPDKNGTVIAKLSSGWVSDLKFMVAKGIVHP